jgi:hypothetical protein
VELCTTNSVPTRIATFDRSQAHTSCGVRAGAYSSPRGEAGVGVQAWGAQAGGRAGHWGVGALRLGLRCLGTGRQALPVLTCGYAPGHTPGGYTLARPGKTGQ